MNLSARLLRQYYLATPAFMVADVFFGENVRAAGFQHHPVMKFVYYGFCFGCFLAMRAWPRWSPLITFSESLINIVSLIFAYVVPYYAFIGNFSEGVITPYPMTVQGSINFLISGTAACLAFYGNPLTSLRQPYSLP